MFAYNKVNMGTGNLLNPSWSGGDGMGGGGFGDGGSSGTSYYYGTGIGQPVPGESYGNFHYLFTSLEYSVGSYGEREGRLRNFHYLGYYCSSNLHWDLTDPTKYSIAVYLPQKLNGFFPLQIIQILS